MMVAGVSRSLLKYLFFKSTKQRHGAVLVLSGPVSTAGPRGYVPGKVFTAVCSIQTQQQSASAESQYTHRIWMRAD